jgi:hypothetical protein
MNASTGTVRRLRALTRIGWHTTALAAELGVSPTTISGLLWAAPAEVSTELHAGVRALYRRLLVQTPPAGTEAGRRAVAVARAAAWLGPMHWGDIEHDPELTEPPADDAPVSFTYLTAANQELCARVKDLETLVQHQEADLSRVLAEQLRSDAALIAATVEAEEAKARLARLTRQTTPGVSV